MVSKQCELYLTDAPEGFSFDVISLLFTIMKVYYNYISHLDFYIYVIIML